MKDQTDNQKNIYAKIYLKKIANKGNYDRTHLNNFYDRSSPGDN